MELGLWVPKSGFSSFCHILHNDLQYNAIQATAKYNNVIAGTQNGFNNNISNIMYTLTWNYLKTNSTRDVICKCREVIETSCTFKKLSQASTKRKRAELKKFVKKVSYTYNFLRN